MYIYIDSHYVVEFRFRDRWTCVAGHGVLLCSPNGRGGELQLRPVHGCERTHIPGKADSAGLHPGDGGMQDGYGNHPCFELGTMDEI